MCLYDIAPRVVNNNIDHYFDSDIVTNVRRPTFCVLLVRCVLLGAVGCNRLFQCLLLSRKLCVCVCVCV